MQNLGSHLRLSESEFAFQTPQMFVCPFRFEKCCSRYDCKYIQAKGGQLNPIKFRNLP